MLSRTSCMRHAEGVKRACAREAGGQLRMCARHRCLARAHTWPPLSSAHAHLAAQTCMCARHWRLAHTRAWPPFSRSHAHSVSAYDHHDAEHDHHHDHNHRLHHHGKHNQHHHDHYLGPQHRLRTHVGSRRRADRYYAVRGFLSTDGVA